MLDNFSDDMLQEALDLDKGHTKLELSGNLTDADIQKYSHMNIDFMSFGALTKHARAMDLSMRVISTWLQNHNLYKKLKIMTRL